MYVLTAPFSELYKTEALTGDPSRLRTTPAISGVCLSLVNFAISAATFGYKSGSISIAFSGQIIAS